MDNARCKLGSIFFMTQSLAAFLVDHSLYFMDLQQCMFTDTSQAKHMQQHV